MDEKPYVEGLNGVCKILVDFPQEEKVLITYPRPLQWIVFYMLDWLHDTTISCCSEEKKQMKINQSTVFCFYLPFMRRRCSFVDLFDEYVLPFLDSSHMTDLEIDEVMWRRIYTVCFKKGSRHILFLKECCFESELYNLSSPIRWGHIQSPELDRIYEKIAYRLRWEVRHCFLSQ